jgi:hypothetical protein
MTSNGVRVANYALDQSPYRIRHGACSRNRRARYSTLVSLSVRPHSMSVASRNFAALAAVLGLLSTATMFLLIELRTSVYRTELEGFMNSALANPSQQIDQGDFPSLHVNLDNPSLLAAILAGLILATLAIVFGVHSRRKFGSSYLNMAGILFGISSVVWLGLIAVGAV